MNTNASPIERFEDGSSNNGAPFINIYDVRTNQGNLVDLIQHDCHGGRFFAIPPNAYPLIVGNSMPVSARPGVQSTVLDHGNIHGSHAPQGMAPVYQTAGPSNAFAGPRNGSFHANLQYASPLPADNPWPPRYPQPYADMWTAQAPHTDLPGPFGSTSGWNNLDTTGFSVQGLQGNPHGASQALRPEYGSNLANTSNVPESFQGGGLHVGNIPQPCPSFNYNARHSSSPGTISSTEELLQEPLGPRSMQSVNAQNAAMAQELRQIIRLSQPEGNRTGAYPHVMDRNPYRGQASQPVTEDEQSMPRPNVFQGLGEGYGHRDPRDISQATHPEPEPRGLAPQEVGLRRRSRAPRVGAGSPRQSRNKRGKRGRPLTQEEKAHAKRVRKLNRKGCIHKRRKAKCTCDDGVSAALGNATRPTESLLQPRRRQDHTAYGSTYTPTSLNSFTGPTTDTRSTPSRHPSFVSHETMPTPADTSQLIDMLQDNFAIDSSQDSHRYALSDNSSIDAPGDTDDEAM